MSSARFPLRDFTRCRGAVGAVQVYLDIIIVHIFKKHCYTDHSVSDAPPSRGVEMCVGRVAGVLEDGGGVDVEVLAAEHQAGPAPALLRRLGNLHLALAWLTHYSSLQERLV